MYYVECFSLYYSKGIKLKNILGDTLFRATLGSRENVLQILGKHVMFSHDFFLVSLFLEKFNSINYN